MSAGLFFFCENSKNQRPGLLGTVGGGFWLWKPHRERWILGQFFGRSASWRRLVIPIYFMYGNRMTMGNRNEVKI